MLGILGFMLLFYKTHNDINAYSQSKNATWMNHTAVKTKNPVLFETLTRDQSVGVH